MAKIIRTEIRRRGVFGLLFKYAFILFNVVMMIWLFSYWGTIDGHIKGATSDAARSGATIGAAIGTHLIVSIWVCGAVILGIFTLLTRGKTVVVEES